MGTALKGSMVLSHALGEPNRAAQWLETIGLMRQTYVFLDSSIVGNPSGYTIKGCLFPIFFWVRVCFISVVIDVLRGVPSFFFKKNKKLSDKSS